MTPRIQRGRCASRAVPLWGSDDLAVIRASYLEIVFGLQLGLRTLKRQPIAFLQHAIALKSCVALTAKFAYDVLQTLATAPQSRPPPAAYALDAVLDFEEDMRESNEDVLFAEP